MISDSKTVDHSVYNLITYIKLTNMLPYIWQVTGANLASYISIKREHLFLHKLRFNFQRFNKWEANQHGLLTPGSVASHWMYLTQSFEFCYHYLQNVSLHRRFTCTTVSIRLVYFMWFGEKKMFGSGLTPHSACMWLFSSCRWRSSLTEWTCCWCFSV